MTGSVKKMLAEMLSVRGLTLDACIESSDITDVEARKLMKLVVETFKPIIQSDSETSNTVDVNLEDDNNE